MTTGRSTLVTFGVGTGSLILAFPPFSLWPLVVLGPMALTALAASAPTGRRAAFRLWLVGLVYFATVNHWLAETHVINYALVGLASSVYYAGFGWVTWRVFKTGASPLFAIPVLWTALEMVRLNWPLNGYPWQLVGQAVAASPVLVQAADVGGVLLLTLLVTTVSGGLAARLAGRRGGALALVVLLAWIVYGVVRPLTLSEPEEGPVLAAIQPGFPQELKDNPVTNDERLDRCLKLSHEAVTMGPTVDLLVWPETMWPYGYLDGEGPTVQREQAAFGQMIARVLASGHAGAALIGTTIIQMPEKTLANGAILVDAEGRRLARYDKHELVPGGETLPWIGALPEALAEALRAFVMDMAGYVPDLKPGPGPAVLELAGHRFGVTICYENAYGSYCRESVRQGAEFLVNISNEGWFGESSEHDHMELQTILRAVENRRAVFRATNTGISCLVRPDGRAPVGADRLEVDGRDRGVAGVLVARVPIHRDATLYTRWGDWPGWLALAAAGVWLFTTLGRVS